MVRSQWPVRVCTATMCQSTIIFTTLLMFTKATGESTEEQHSHTYNYFYPPSTLNFHDLYSNSLALLSDEPTGTPPLKADEFHLNSMSPFLDFPHNVQSIPHVTTPRNNKSKNSVNMTKSSQELPDDSVQVLPVKQRGVLDLLFPTSRVKGFKSIFDMFRRILSHTF